MGTTGLCRRAVLDDQLAQFAGYVARSVSFLVAIIAQVRRMGRGGQNDLRGFKWLIAKISS